MVNRKKSLRGFTLIELLVVIAIIGLLASIVLVSLGGARDRAKDARIISDMGQLRSTAEVYYGNNNNYTGLCSHPDVTTLKADINAQQTTAYFVCDAAATDYCIEVKLNNGQWWCIDSKLRSQQYAADPPCALGTRRCQ